jgi:hypothetical protein
MLADFLPRRYAAALALHSPAGSTPAITCGNAALLDITVVSLERGALSPRELMLARLAALIAVDAPAASYLANAGAAADSGDYCQ